jgi:hypothetical protein
MEVEFERERRNSLRRSEIVDICKELSWYKNVVGVGVVSKHPAVVRFYPSFGGEGRQFSRYLSGVGIHM